MEAIDLLLNRYSQPKLVEPAPDNEQLNVMMKAAMKVPDHAGLSPWRFIVCEGEGLHRLGKVFHQAAVKENMSQRDQNRAKELPLRAPMVIVVINQAQSHPKVPEVEQIASTSCAVYAMQLAAQAQGLSSMWRTGTYAHSNEVKQGLGMKDSDEIIAFLYVGTGPDSTANKAEKNPSEFLTLWNK